MSLTTKLKSKGIKKVAKSPIWAGPSVDAPNGGITYSLLSRFLCCRERFRLLVVEGLRPQPAFNQRMEYGNMWHICEEHHAKGVDYLKPLKSYATELCREFKLQGELIQHWYEVCKTQFPVYVKYWSEHNDVKNRTPIQQEYVFNVPYELPSRRTVYIRGKWDSLDQVGTKKNGRLWLQENKAKGDIEEMKLATQLRFDLQSMMYYLVLYHYYQDAKAGNAVFPFDPGPPAGIRYNVVRRPLSGGKHSIRQKQNESAEEFYTRLGELIAEEPEHYFVRWNVEIAKSDVQHFEQRFFIPVMEQLCDWWDYMQQCNYNPWSEEGKGGFLVNPDTNDDGPYYVQMHWQFPNGVYNPILESNHSELDEYLATGSMLGLVKNARLFTELNDV